MNEIAGPLQALLEKGGPGLLADQGIVWEGTSEALGELRRMLADKPIGQALLLIAEQGRHYGIRLFSTPPFDRQRFLKDAARFGMDSFEAIFFIDNLTPLPDRVAAASPRHGQPRRARRVKEKRLPRP